MIEDSLTDQCGAIRHSFYPPPPDSKPRLTSVSIRSAIAVHLLLAVAAAFLVHVGDGEDVAEAQASQSIQITPGNFGTYFEIDATTEVAKLKPDYNSNHTLVFGPGTYSNAIEVESAENLIIRGANSADSSQAATIQANKIIEDARGAGNGAIFAIKSSTDVTIDNLNFDYQCLFDAAPRNALYGLFYQDTSGTISNNVMENYWYVFGQDEDGNTIPNPCQAPRGVGTSSDRASFRAIRVDMTASHEPNIDANGKVTNPLPIRVTGNKLSRVDRSGINVYGYFDVTIDNNDMHGINTSIQITGGASATVRDNRISQTTAGIAYGPNWFVPNSPDGETIEANIEIRGNDIKLVSSAGISLGFGWCTPADGTRINTNANIIGNYIHEGQPASNWAAIQIASCAGAEDERIKAEIIGNTLEEVPAGPNPDAIGIFGAPSFNSGTSATAWFEVNAKYNEITGFALGARITNTNAGDTFGIAHARIHASNNYWGTGTESPAHLIDDVIQMPDKAGITYEPWLHSRELAGWYGPYGTRERESLTATSTSQSPILVAELNPVVISVPAGTVGAEDVVFSIREVEVPSPRGFSVAGSPDIVDISLADSDGLLKPVTVCLPAVQGLSGEQVLLHFGDGAGARWRALPKATPPAGYESGWVCGRTSDFSFFMVAGIDPDILIRPAHILRIEPSIRSVTVSADDRLRLELHVHGVQNVLDNDLEGVSYTVWSDGGGGGSFDGSGRRVTYTAPSAPGVYSVTAELASTVCRGTQGQCTARFEIRVRRPSATVLEPTAAPLNPVGDIPTVLVDGEGGQYEVFTPKDGGAFVGETFSIVAPTAAVSNGEIIGLRMAEAGAASNVGMTAQRYTLGGSRYEVSAVDAAGSAIASYALKAPAEVCVPLPAELRGNIRDIALVAINPDASLTILSARVIVNGPSLQVCANLSALPATVAVGTAGAPVALPTPTPVVLASTLPETGGYAPPFGAAAAIIVLILGLVAISMLGFIFTRRVSA